MRLLLPIFSFWFLLYSCGIQKVDLPEALNEVSGIEQISKDLYVSINDSGDEPYLYVFNSSGEIHFIAEISSLINDVSLKSSTTPNNVPQTSFSEPTSLYGTWYSNLLM